MANDFKRGIKVYLETSDYGKGIADMVAATKKYETELENLTAESKKMTAEGNNSGKAWDDLQKKIKLYEKQLIKSQATENDYRAKLAQTEKVLNNLSGVSYNELVAVQKQLQKELKTTTRGTDEHKTKLEQYERVTKEVNTAQGEMNSNIGRSGSLFSRAADGFNKYLGIAATGLAAITGLTLGLKKFMDMRRELEDSQANLKALTGLGDSDITWLTEQAKLMSTSTDEMGISIKATSKEIIDGYTVIGSKRPELLKNKEAMADVTKQALILAAAGKMEVATAFDAVTASMNQFDLGAEESTRIINTIAAGSLEGSAEADNLAGSLKNVGTVAKSSNMSLEQTVAALEVLASKQLLGEEAGTKLRGALLKMKAAGVGYASGQFDLRDAIVEVNGQISQQTSQFERDALMQKIFGAENISTGQILLENVDQYDKLTVAVTGTNVAFTQAQINTATVSTKLAQAQNRFNELGMNLVEKLNPAMLSATNFTNKFLKLLIVLPKWLNENKGLLISLAVIWTTYTIAVNASIIADKLKVFWTDKVVLSVSKLSAAIKANPWGLIATGVVLAISWLSSYLDKQREVNKEQAKFNDLAAKSNELYANNKPLEERAKAMQSLSATQLETLKSDLQSQLDAQSAFDAEIKTRAQKAMDEDTELLKWKKKQTEAKTMWEKSTAATQIRWREDALLKELAAEFSKNNKSKAGLIKYLNDVDALLKTKNKPTSTITPASDPDKKAYENALKAKEDAYKVSQLELMELRRTGELTEVNYNKIALETQLQFLNEKLALQKKFKKDTIDTEIEISTQKSKIEQDADKFSIEAIKLQQQAGLKALESAQLTKQEMLQESLNRGIITEKEYNTEIKKLVVELETAKLALAEASLEALNKVKFNDKETQKAALETAIAEIKALKAALVKAQGDVAKDAAVTVEKSTVSVAERMESIFGKSFSNIGNLFTTFTESLNKLKAGDLKSWTDWGAAIGDIVQSALVVATEVNDQYFEYKAASLEADKQRELTNAGDSAEQREIINAKYAQKELDLKKKQSSADTVLKVAQAVAAGGLAIVQAFAQLGPIGGAIAAILVGGITTFQVGTILKQNAAIQATTLDSSTSATTSTTQTSGARVAQAASGRWDVIGEEDGKLYRNVPYTGVARTGIVSRPTLVGEEPEIVIDNPTTRNIIMNAPWLLGEIKRHRVPQRASGKYDTVDSATAGASGGSDSSALVLANLEAMRELITLIRYLKENGIDAWVLLSDIEKQQILLSKSKKKGSAK